MSQSSHLSFPCLTFLLSILHNSSPFPFPRPVLHTHLIPFFASVWLRKTTTNSKSALIVFVHLWHLSCIAMNEVATLVSFEIDWLIEINTQATNNYVHDPLFGSLPSQSLSSLSCMQKGKGNEEGEEGHRHWPCVSIVYSWIVNDIGTIPLLSSPPSSSSF